MEKWILEFWSEGRDTKFPVIFGPMPRWKIRALLKARGFTEVCTQPHEAWTGKLKGKEAFAKLRQVRDLKWFFNHFK